MTLQSTDPLATAFAAARDSLTRVDERHLGEPTPCQSWDVHALINHMVGAPRFAVGVVSGSNAENADADFAAGDFVAAHDETARAALDAFGEPGALDRPLEPFGGQPASFLMFFVASDQLAHAWDLTRAIGGPTDIEPDLAAEFLEMAKSMVNEEMRGADGTAPFGPEQVAPSGGTGADQLAAFYGRRV